MCKNNCKICDNIVVSDSVTLLTVDGVDTVVIDVPAASFRDGQRICLVIAQTIPTTATIVAPVAISIGGDTATVYPLVRCDCTQATVCAIRTRTRYPLMLKTNATGGVFKALRGLACAPDNALPAIPAP